jgi:hypothetical protein
LDLTGRQIALDAQNGADAPKVPETDRNLNRESKPARSALCARGYQAQQSWIPDG